MRFKKKVALTILMVVSVLCLIFGAVACKDDSGNGGMSAKDAIARYLLPQNQTLVDADFTLPKTIGSADSPITVEWKSSNTDAIAIEDKGESYNAKVTIQDQVTEVTLTISAEGNSKDFTVRVDGFSVYTFLDNYNFPQEKAAVKADFDLDTETTYQGKKATISWKIDDAYSAWIKLNGNKVLVTPGEELVSVEIEATFSYNGETATQKYTFSVSPNLDHLQNVNNMYSQSGIPLEFEGYVLHVYVAANDAKYGPMASFFAVDKDFCSGYYIWQAALESEEDVAKVVPGAHFTFSGDVTKNYNGLWESNGYEDGTAVFDGATPINIDEHIRAFDVDYLSEVQSAKWQMSRLVTLTGWTVKTAAKDDGKENLKLTLTNGGKDIDVYTSTYVTTDTAAMTALKTKLEGLTVGSFVNIKGILGYNEGYRLQPRTADDITSATAAATYEDATKVNAAVKAVDDAVKANFASLVATHKEVDMPVSVEGVTIEYKVAGATNPTVVINGSKFTIDPIDSEKNYDIQVTYKIGDYEGYSFFKLHNWKLSDAEIVKNVKEALGAEKIDDINRAGEFDLPVVDDLGTTITWKVKETSLSWISVADGKIKVASLPAEDTEVTLVATIVLNSETATVELKVNVAKASALVFKALDAPAAGDYIFALYQGNLDKWLYATGEINSSNFGVTTENSAEAATFTLVASGEGWTIQLKSTGKFLELNNNHRMCFVDASTQAWKWNAEHKVFTFDVTESGSPVTYYIGSYNEFNTFSASKASFLGSSTNFVAQFGSMVAAELTFKAIDEPAAGTYKFAMYSDNKKATYYATGEMSGYYFATSEDVSEAADFVITQIGNENKYTVTVGGKYLEIVPRTDGNTGVNIALNDAQTAGKYWQWNEAIKNFVMESTYNKDNNAEATDTDLYYLGTYSTYTTMSGTNIGRIATKGDDGSYTANNAEGASQWVAHFGTMVVGEPGTTEPEPEEPELPEGGTQDDPYTIAEALTVANALDSNAYSETKFYITGYVVDAGSWSDDYGNWSNIYLADSAEGTKADGIQLYRLNPDDTYLKLANDLTVGAKITVYGYLQNYKGNTPEISFNGSSDKVTVISYTDPRTVDQKIKVAIDAVKLPEKVTGDIDLPKSTVTGVTLTFVSGNEAITVGEDKLTVKCGATDVSVEITVSASAEGATAQSKKLTVIVRSANTKTATLSFDSTENRTTQTTETQVWMQNGITFTNNKGTGSPIADNSKPVRCYKNSSIKVEFTSAMKEIVFHCNSNSTSYASDLQKSIAAAEGVTVTVSGKDVTVAFATPTTTFEIASLSAQIRIDSIDVIYDAPAAAVVSVTPVAILPGKEF